MGAAFGANAAPLHLHDLGAQLGLRDAVNALRLKGAMVNARGVPRSLQCAVGVFGPLLAPLLQKLFVVPGAVFLPEALMIDVSHGQQDVTVRRVAFGVMHRKVGDHAVLCKLAFGEVAHQLALLLKAQLDGQRYFHFPTHLRIFALLGRLDQIPEFGAGQINQPSGSVGRKENLGVVNAGLLAVVKRQSGALVHDEFARPISRRPGRTASGGSADGFGGKVIDRHDARSLMPQAAHVTQ